MDANTEHKAPGQPSDQEQKRRLGPLLFRWVRNLFLGVLFLFAVLAISIQVPAVQNWAVQKISNSLSKTLNTTVTLDRVYLKFFDRLVMEGFYVEDYRSDTLLFAEELEANFNTGIVALIRRKLGIKELYLRDAGLYLHRSADQEYTNLQEVLAALIKPADEEATTQGTGQPFWLNIKRVFVQNLEFEKVDSLKGSDLVMHLCEGDIKFNELNLPQKKMDVAFVYLDQPLISIKAYKWSPMLDSMWLKWYPAKLPIPEEPDTFSIDLPQDTLSFFAQVDALDVRDGAFRFDSYRNAPEKLTRDDILDYQHLNVFDIGMNIRDLSFTEGVFKGQANRIAFRDFSGFVCDRLSSKEVIVSSEGVHLYDMKLITPTSELGDTIILTYKAYSNFKEFPDRVKMDVRFNNASVSVDDIMVFAPVLEDNIFFRKNRKEVLQIDGRVSGKVNSLRGKDLNIRLADDTWLKGEFSSFNLAVRDLQSLNLRLEQLVTNMSTLQDLIPNFRPPDNFNKLGRLRFEGSFDGFFTNFVAYGDLRSDLGRAIMDMQMDISKGREKAKYRGKLSLINFDLGGWAENPSLGKVTFTSQVNDGVGLTAATANANLTANIDSLTIRGYNYKDLALRGQLNKNLFDGAFTSEDENINFRFDGTIDFTSRVPRFDFYSNIQTLALKKLNWSDQDIVIGGKVDLDISDIDLDKIQGTVALNDFRIRKDQQKPFVIDSVWANTTLEEEERCLALRSNLVDADALGAFKFKELPEALIQYFVNNFPRFSEKIGVKSKGIELDTSRLDFTIKVKDTEGLLALINPKLKKLGGLTMEGAFNSAADSLKLDAEVTEFLFGDFGFDDIAFSWDGQRDTSFLELILIESQIGTNFNVPRLNLLGLVKRDTFEFGLTAYNFSEILDDLELDAFYYVAENGDNVIRFDDSDLVIWNKEWTIKKDNYIRFGKDFIRVRDFALWSENRSVVLESSGRKGLNFFFRNFDLELLNELWDYDILDFEGRFDVEARVQDIFELKGLQAALNVDTFTINSDDWGRLRFDAESESLSDEVRTFVSLSKPGQQLLGEGVYQTPLFQEKSKSQTNTRRPNYLDFNVALSNFPLRILEYWIGAGASNTVGLVNADNIRFYGEPSQIELEGDAYVTDAAVTIDYINTRYYIDRERIRLSSDFIDATGAKLTDSKGGTANIFGGIAHDHLRNLRLNTRISTSNFLALNTTKEDNNLYYGTAYADGNIIFSGPFQKPDIYINARSNPGTKISIPVNFERDASEVNFITFKEKQTAIAPIEGDQSTTAEELLGVRVDMDLNITKEAEIEIVFDEQTGDVLKGRGNGNLQIVVPRTLDFLMYGDYEVTSGDYLFTLMNLGVNKPFKVREGGTIRWSGDPYGAEIDIAAQYKDLKAPLTNFIAEYLVSASTDASRAARIPTEVDLVMNLTGNLLNPTINFDLDFPKLIGELKNYSDNKVRILRQDQNEMNRQVFGLIVIGQFLPSDFRIQGSQLNIVSNTVTELLSQQLSLYLTELVSEWLTEDGLISGIDFDIGLTYLQDPNLLGDNAADYYGGSELQVRLNNYLFDDRLSVNVGGNFDLSGSNYLGDDLSAGVLFAGDLVVEYFLTEQRNLKVRFYQSTEPEIGGGRRNKTGLGLSFRKEFDTFREFLQGLKRQTKKVKKDSS